MNVYVRIASAQKLKLQFWARYYSCQPYYSLLLLLLLLDTQYEVLRLTEAYRSKRPVVHSMSIGIPSLGLQQELDSDPDTR